MNIQTDLLPLSPSVLQKMSCSNLELIAREGTKEQKDCLLDWGYGGLPAFLFEELFFLATGEEWEQD